MIYICITVYFHTEQAKVIMQILQKYVTKGKFYMLFCELGYY